MTKKRRSTPLPDSLADPVRAATDYGDKPHAAVTHRTSAAKRSTEPIVLTVQTPPVPSGLYIVATPIGNLDDVSLRMLATLGGVDRIACEDTRVTARLLARYGIATRTTAYHDHNAQRVLPKLIEALQNGDSMALVSDAGTPLVSDPGLRLVRAAIEAGIAVTTIPGPAAAIAGLTLAGLPVDRFLFAGFLPARGTARRTALAELAAVPATLVFYEAPHRLAAALVDMAAVLGERDAAVARELTKLHEEVRRGTLSALAESYEGDAAPRGEIVVLVGPPGAQAVQDDAEQLDARLHEALSRMSVRDAAALVAAETGWKRREVYARALALAQEAGTGKP
jgi:16S rRNA (cytidine1402-2'-O)-methyltransferase